MRVGGAPHRDRRVVVRRSPSGARLPNSPPVTVTPASMPLWRLSTTPGLDQVDRRVGDDAAVQPEARVVRAAPRRPRPACRRRRTARSRGRGSARRPAPATSTSTGGGRRVGDQRLGAVGEGEVGDPCSRSISASSAGQRHPLVDLGDDDPGGVDHLVDEIDHRPRATARPGRRSAARGSAPRRPVSAATGSGPGIAETWAGIDAVAGQRRRLAGVAPRR